MDTSKTEYPPNHKVGMKVPVGGSDCAKCSYWTDNECSNKYFRQWNNRSGKIPTSSDRYCCDFFETSKKEA